MLMNYGYRVKRVIDWVKYLLIIERNEIRFWIIIYNGNYKQ